jgi:hypothetical protein
LKLCRNINRGKATSKKLNWNESSRLSLTTAGSSTNAALGGVSAGGIGTPEFDVTQSGGGPSAFVASQPGGNAGGTTPSKSSFIVISGQQFGHWKGVGVGPAAGILMDWRSSAVVSDTVVGTGECGPAWLLGRDNAIAAKKSTPAETRAQRKTVHHADDVDAPFGSRAMTPFY